VLDSIAFEGMDERLLKYLKARKETLGGEGIHATHQEIATDLNASREAVSRMLKKLERMGMVELGRNEVKLLEQ
jgi:CRP/FNR family transcriptional regulator